MQSKRVIQPGHALATVFVALLLVGARGFLVAHPVIAGLLLAAFAPVYYFAARITAYRQFLYPAILLLVLAYQLLVHGAGAAVAHQPLLALVPIALIYAAALAGRPRGIARGTESLYGSADLVVACFALWVLIRVAWFFEQAPISAALALLGYAAYTWLRFLRVERVAYALATVALGSGAFLYLLYSHSNWTVRLGAIVALWLVSELSGRGVIPRLETLALALVGCYLLLVGLSGTRELQLPLGYLVLAMAWLALGLLLYRPERQRQAGPGPVLLPRLLPLFVAGVVLGLLPVALFYPWKSPTLAVSFLTIFFVTFLAAGRELAKHALSLIGVGLTRTLSGLGRIAPLAALLYLGWKHFPPAYGLALGALCIGLFSLLAGWRQEPRVLVRRNIYVYQAGAFFTLAYFLAERRLAPAGALGVLLDSGTLLVLAIIAVGYALQRRLPQPYLRSLYDVASVASAAACVLFVLRGPIALQPALIFGSVLLAASALAFLRVRRVAVLFTWPVVAGLWIYVMEWLGGARGEVLGMPYFVWGMVSAPIGYLLLRRRNAWHELFYFMWFLCAGVSLTLFYPYHGVGAYAAPLWPLALLLVARAEASRRDFPFSLVLELLSPALASASLIVLLYDRLYWPAAVALTLYALLYAGVAVQRRLWFYLYPAAGCAVAANFLVVLPSAGARLFLPYLFPLAAVFYALASLLKRRGHRAQARPFDLAASAGAVVGALLFLRVPFDSFVTTGWLTGLAYLALYLVLTRATPERAFLSGAGLAGAFTIYQLLPLFPQVTKNNRLAYFIPVAFLLAVLGWWRARRQDERGAWALYAAAIATAAAASLFALWPPPASTASSRAVLLVVMLVWLVLLLWTRREIFVYCATLALAMLAYNFVQSSADVFGQHLVAFFLYGTALLGLVFIAAAARNLVRFRRPTLFVSPTRWHHRLLYLAPVAVLGAAVFGSWGVSTSSNPSFCGSCHDMSAYYANWKGSTHARAQIGCAACHYEPGMRGYLKAKLQGTSQLVTTITRTQTYKPVAHVGDRNCLSGSCHSTQELDRHLLVRNTFSFNHSTHLGKISRGPELRCTSCHTNVGPETHFGVDTNACFTCHFQAASPPRPATTAGCVGCHGVPQGGRGASQFDHVASAVAADDAACASCHAGLTRGTPAVEERQCRHCHLERAQTLLAAGSAAIHAQHVGEKEIGCDWCHGVIKHGNR